MLGRDGVRAFLVLLQQSKPGKRFIPYLDILSFSCSKTECTCWSLCYKRLPYKECILDVFLFIVCSEFRTDRVRVLTPSYRVEEISDKIMLMHVLGQFLTWHGCLVSSVHGLHFCNCCLLSPSRDYDSGKVLLVILLLLRKCLTCAKSQRNVTNLRRVNVSCQVMSS